MKTIDLTCPHCGAVMSVDSSMKQASCEHCGASILIDDEVQHIQYDNAEEAGYNFEKGRQRAKEEAQARYQQTYSEEPKKKKRIWLWVLGWICIFPLPLTIILVRKKDMNPALKYGIIAIAWAIYLIIGLSGRGSNENTATNDNNVSGVNEYVANADNDSSEEIVDQFVDSFNQKSDIDLDFVEDFVPSDKNGLHYRTEFRLTAYSNAIGRSYNYGDVSVDLVSRTSTLGDGIIRVYLDNASLEQCLEIIEIASPIMDKSINESDLNEALEYIENNKSANGYYYSNLGLTLSGNENDGFDLMLKMKND